MNLFQVAHLYVGCKFQFIADGSIDTSVGYYDGNYYFINKKAAIHLPVLTPLSAVKIILRKLDSIHLHELDELININPFYKSHNIRLAKVERGHVAFSYYVQYDFKGRWYSKSISPLREIRPDQLAYLISRKFDVFNLIDTGEAIDEAQLLDRVYRDIHNYPF